MRVTFDDFVGVAGPLAEAGMPLSASGAASMLERMAPVDPKATQPGPVKFTGAGENAMMVGQQTPLEWNPADPLVSQFIGEARAALTQQIRQQAYQQPNPPGTWLSRRFGSPELRTPEAEAQVQHLAQQMASRRGFVPTTPGAAPSGVNCTSTPRLSRAFMAATRAASRPLVSMARSA